MSSPLDPTSSALTPQQSAVDELIALLIARLKKTLDSIQHVASVLCINARLVEVAKRYYKLVVEKRLTKGRRRKDLACACLYIACRVSGAPYLLIDFQNVVGRSMYAIGRVYVDIARALYLHIPVTDPSLFIGRFCSKL